MKESKNDDNKNEDDFDDSDDDEKTKNNVTVVKTALRFDVVAKLKPGETLKIVGSILELGNWDCENGLALSVVGKSPVER